MSVLIEELKREHSEILASLNEANEIGILSREGQAKLMSVKAVFLEHLKKEDEQLYPALIKSFKETKITLNLFSMDMENVSRTALEFFDKYSDGVIDAEFEGKFETLFVALGKRIRSEEDLLFEEYEKMNE